METLIKSIAEKATEMIADMNKGSKASMQRARKASLELEKMFKQYRKESIEASKK